MPVIFSTFMTWLLSQFTERSVKIAVRIAIGASFVLMIITAITAYLTAASTIISVIGMTTPDIVSGVWGWVMPSNTNLCFTVIGSVYMLRFATSQYFLIMNTRFRAAISG